MAGTTRRKDNIDKYYYVLDETGGSSDIDSSDSDQPKRNDNCIEDKKEEKKMESTTNCSLEGGLVNKQHEKSSKHNDVDMDMDSESEGVSNRSEQIPPLIKVTFRDEATQIRFSGILAAALENKANCMIVSNHLEFEVWTAEETAERSLGFSLDAAPSLLNRGHDIPYYGMTNQNILSDQVEQPKFERKQALGTCWNCSESHNLRDCPHPRDHREINRNRLKFQSEKAAMPKSSRYHLDEHQKFEHLQPGQISKKLQDALNLAPDQLAPFIYRMRRLGYPPGWLEEARVSHSGVVMYNVKGELVLEDDDEEGEIFSEGAKDKFDTKKIIEFPGYNMPLDKDVKDESDKYNCPKFCPQQSREIMLAQLGGCSVKAYKKRSLVADKDTSSEVKSPSIEEMESKKQKLMAELEDEKSMLEVSNNGSLNDSGEAGVLNDSGEAGVLNDSTGVGQVKGVNYGTPVLKSVSPFSKLPTRECFSVNIADVINFENLPDSTGKYETMSSLITKIRETVTKIQKEDV